MRLLELNPHDEVGLAEDPMDSNPAYAILSHTWGPDKDEVTFNDLRQGHADRKVGGYAKLQFCGKQAKKDGLHYFWVDTCSINKDSHSELSEAITSMFRWYQEAARCYVFLSDISVDRDDSEHARHLWEAAFRKSRWFTRGWTLQELLAPASVEFFSREGRYLGSKGTLEGLIHEITSIPIAALRGTPLSDFPDKERLRWTTERNTTKPEDQAYCLLGIFNIFMPLMYGEGENAIRRLKEKIRKRAHDYVALPVHQHWLVPRSPSPLFTGRHDILEELSNTIRESVHLPQKQTQHRIVITGMGGQGKSEIGLQLAHRFRQQFWGVFWIDVSTTDLAERAFVEIAQKLSFPASTWKDARLGIANLKHPWLLVLDNADNLDIDYQQYFPDGPLGVVLLTSRNEDCQQYANSTVIALQGLSEGEGRELLLKAARIPTDQYGAVEHDAAVVAGLLQSHPLALIQAGAFVSRGHCSLAKYPDIYERQRQRLLTFRPAQAQSRYRDVYATFEMSADMLTKSKTEVAQDALQLLPLLVVGGLRRLPLPVFEAGWRGAQSVPKDKSEDAEDGNILLLTPWHVAHLPSLTLAQDENWDSFRLVEAVNLLKVFALVSTDSVGGHLSVSMHPLVHAWARDRQEARQRHASWLQMGCLMAVGRMDGVVWARYQTQLQPHLEALVGWETDVMFAEEPAGMVARTLLNVGWILYQLRSDSVLFVLMEKMLAHLQLNQGDVDGRWLGVYDLTGRNLVNYGKVREAVPMLEQVVKIEEQTLAEDHPSRLASQHELARAYQANGQVKEAVALLEVVVKIKEQTLAEDHPSRLASQYELAGAYRANGQVKEAVALLEVVVKIWEQTLAEDYPSRLASQHELAGAYQANGQVKKAVALLEIVIKIKEQTLAEDHPSRLASQHELAGAYRANGQVMEAVALLEVVVKIEEQTLAEDHPSRLASQHELARAYQANGQVMEAVALLEVVVKIWEQTLADDHPSRLASQYELARAYQANGQVMEAVALLEVVVKIDKQTLAEDHPSRLASQYELARAYQANRQVKEAVALLEVVVKIWEQTLAEDHPSRLASQHELARAYQANGQVKEAVALLEVVVKIKEQTLAEDHPSRLASQYNLAICMWDLGSHTEALGMMARVAEIQKKVLDESHPDRQNSEDQLTYFENEMAKLAIPEIK